jgi:hypothetical protein
MGFWSINDLGEHTGMLANKLQVNGFFAHLREYFLADKPQVNVFLAHLGECILPQVNGF